MSRIRLAALLALLLLSPAALACLWDYDTLQQERSRFPSTLELITGKFLRHSKEFYEWRIKDRLKKLEDDPSNLSWLDDLAAAYDKTGQHQKAIDTALAAGKIQPGRYETEANLGTFYIHSGQLEKGLEHIDIALRINPDAHFGREKYQRLLVEYILLCRQDGAVPLPLTESKASVAAFSRGGVAAFLAKGKKGEAEHNSGRLSEEERSKAIKGVLGMMRFGNHESPALLEALASLLSQLETDAPTQDAKQLAARAYLKASYVVREEAAKKAYREMAKAVLSMQTKGRFSQVQMTIQEVEDAFAGELTEARQWYDSVREDELRWIREGKDVDQEFTRKYYEEPQVSTPWAESIQDSLALNWPVYAAGSGLLLGGLCVWQWRRRRSEAVTKQHL